MYKYETHMHTREASACAWSSGAEMAEKYKSEGYTGIIVTDHFFNGNSAIPRDLPWKERIELYCKGYENAKARGDRIGLDVFFGFEYGDGGSDFLVYGLDKQWLIENDHILDIGLTNFLEYARSPFCGRCGGSKRFPYKGGTLRVQRQGKAFRRMVRTSRNGRFGFPQHRGQMVRRRSNVRKEICLGSGLHKGSG